MIGGNFILNNAENVTEHNAKISYRYREILKKRNDLTQLERQ